MQLHPYLAQLQELAVPLAIAALIVLFSVISFTVWATRIRRVRSAVNQLDASLANNTLSSRSALDSAEKKTQDPELKFLLRETLAGLIDLPSSKGSLHPSEATQASEGLSSYSFRSHADTWTVRSVLGGRLNLALFETMPNLLIGFGLMCTFIFLAVALQQAGLALNALDVSARQQDQALQSLIATAGGKFITSIAGLLCSLVWNWRAKVALENLQASIDTLCHTLRSKVPDNAAEASVRMQLALFQDILQENRSQVNQLQRFETDFANAIGDALSRHMQPAFDKLATLTDTIQTSSQSFGNAGSQAAGELKHAGEVLTQGIEKGLGSFQDTVASLSQTIQTTRNTVAELDAALARATTAGNQGSQQLTTLLGSFGQAIASVQWSDKGFAQMGQKPALGLEAGLDVVHRSSMWGNDANTTTSSDYALAPSYTLLNARVRQRYQVGSARIEAFVGIDNLTDKNTVGSVIINQFSKQYFEPGLPRSWVVGLQSQIPL